MTQNTNIEINFLKKCQKKSIKFMPNLPEFEEKTKKVFRFLQHVPESKPEYKRILKIFEL